VPYSIQRQTIILCLFILWAGCEQPPPENTDAVVPTVRLDSTTITVAIPALDVPGTVVTADFLPPDLRPLVGRFFVETDFRSDQEPVAVVSYDLWRTHFKSLASLIGTEIEANGYPVIIVGVAPPGFQPPGSGLIWLSQSRERAEDARLRVQRR